MGFLSGLTNKFKAEANKYSGNKDFIEAVAAATALVAAADGSIDDSEIQAAIEVATNNATLSAAYSGSQIEEEIGKQLRKAKTISGKAQLKREIEDVANKELALREDVFLVAADVAASDGNIADVEKKVLLEIAGILRVDAKKFL